MAPAINDDILLLDGDATLADLPVGREVRIIKGPNIGYNALVRNHHKNKVKGLTVLLVAEDGFTLLVPEVNKPMAVSYVKPLKKEYVAQQQQEEEEQEQQLEDED